MFTTMLMWFQAWPNATLWVAFAIFFMIMMCFIPSSGPSWCVEYAKSNRSMCNGRCKNYIQEGTLRIGKYSESGGHHWSHLGCLSAAERRWIRKPSNIHGLKLLNDKDIERIVTLLEKANPEEDKK